MKFFLHYTSIYFPIIPLLVFTFFSFNRQSKPKWIIFLILIAGIFTDVISFNLAKDSKNTLWLINIFTILESLLLTYFFSLLLKTKTQKIILVAFFVGFSCMWLFRNLIRSGLNSFDFYSQTIEFLFLLIFCLLFYFEKSKVTDSTFIYNTYEFWLVSALLIYCAGTFFSFLTPMSGSELDKNTIVFEYISRIGNIIKSILITVAFCINPAKLSKNRPNPNSIYYIKDLKE